MTILSVSRPKYRKRYFYCFEVPFHLRTPPLYPSGTTCPSSPYQIDSSSVVSTPTVFSSSVCTFLRHPFTRSVSLSFTVPTLDPYFAHINNVSSRLSPSSFPVHRPSTSQTLYLPLSVSTFVRLGYFRRVVETSVATSTFSVLFPSILSVLDRTRTCCLCWNSLDKRFTKFVFTVKDDIERYHRPT